MSQPITPKVRDALLLALHTTDYRLVRGKGGFVRKAVPDAGAVTIRTANTMQADGLVDFDQPMFPTSIALTARGVEVAEQLRAVEQQKAGAA